MLSSAITGRSIADGAGGAALGGARLTRGSGGVRSHCYEFLGVWIVVTPIGQNGWEIFGALKSEASPIARPTEQSAEIKKTITTKH